ncbi:MAG: LysR family transcriptional regulator, partial [Firmicutes bacterium]|nr:LysR family transcriptional regulator [Bacillota bacterium]
MDIKQLKAFMAVANTQSFLNAADQLFISRQAVSKTITKLEEELETRLFVRGQNG